MCQVTGVGAVVILLYSSRACYNLVVLALSNNTINSFDYDWYNVSDQVSRRFQALVLEGVLVVGEVPEHLGPFAPPPGDPDRQFSCPFQADLQLTLGDTGYIVFGVVLFVWELLPTSLLVFFFRVRQPTLDRVSRAGPTVPFTLEEAEGCYCCR